MIAELDRRQRLLTRFGLLCLGCALVTAALQLADPRLLGEQSVWAKPTRFHLSVGLFALTAAWFYGDVDPARRGGRWLTATAILLVIAGGFEVAWITVQGARGQISHFNLGGGFATLMFALMGVFAVLLVGTTLPLAAAVARAPRAGIDPAYRLAAILGLLLTFLLGGGLGGYMSSMMSHAVGAEGGALPVTGWNRAGGDLRVAHFLGIHAEQLLPAAAVMAGALPARARTPAVIAAALLLVVATLAAFAQAVAGRPPL